MVSLSDSDYDALYEVFREAMPKVGRDLFPEILSMLVADGVLTVRLTEHEIIVGSLQAPEVGVQRIERKTLRH